MTDADAAPAPVRHVAVLGEDPQGARAQARSRGAPSSSRTSCRSRSCVPLTGGYRRIPVLQIGADVYCDSQLIARVLERRHPEPTIYPDGSEATAHAWNLWADRLLFMPAVAVVFADIGAPRAAGLHRRPLEDDAGPQLRRRPEAGAARARAAARARRDRRGASSPTAARGSSARPSAWPTPPCYHPLWFLRVAPGGQALLAEFPRVARLAGARRRARPGRPPRRRAGRRARHRARRASRRRRPASSPASRTASPPAHEVTRHAGRLRLRPGRRHAGGVIGRRGRHPPHRPGARRRRGPLPALRLPRRAASLRSRLAALQGHGV